MPDQEKHYFLTVLLTDKYLQSSLVSNNGQGIQTKEFSEIKTYFDRKDLLEQLDKSLQELGPDSQDIADTVFAFDSNWLDGSDLTDVKKPIVKEISEELSLDAIGQFSIAEGMAEARLIGDENDSCLLLIFKDESFDLIFLKHGQLLDVASIGRSGNIVDDFNEMLARASKHLGQDDGKYLPNKVLMASIALKQKELTALHEELIKQDWTSHPGFTQAPNIVVLESDYMIKSISLSAGKILTKEKFLATMPVKSFDDEKAESVQELAKEVGMDTSHDQSTPVPGPVMPEVKEEYAVEKPSATSFGIKFDKNIFNQNEEGKISKEELAIDNEIKPKNNKKRSAFDRFYLTHKKIILLGAATGLFGIVLIFSIFALFFSKVRVVLTPEQTLLQENVSITLDPNIEESNFSKALLKASLEDKEINGQDVKETTGIGLVGEKAKGKVTVYNKTSEETELSSGTVLSSDGIDFFLDETIKVPGAVEKNGGSGVDYGKIETAVTAKDIGSDANFNKDTKFRVGDYYDDKFSAVANDNFSGGSSREVRVVAEADLNALSSTLTNKLVEEAKKDFTDESKDGVHLVPTGNIKTIKSDFSAKVGDETDSLTLDMTLNVEAIKYLSTDLKSLALAMLKADLPENYIFMDEDPSLLSGDAQTATGSSKVKLSADLSAKAMANLNQDSLRALTLGKDWQQALSDLEADQYIKSAQIIFNPPFLGNILRKLPSDQSRVTFELSK